ncbi:probable glycosyltransferase At3g07620 isoform X2 [Cryptomeria japonica]|uniref:probable glycosyltransferase At3g07620 isoform X2 n=1 Tax=Cryptomeria japonica TaxID=3369 RepID=UPI0027D9F3C4|nr:probable glycosyltransferase At3g07620 isoform X2 [Cryptomeria japonica]
MEFGGFVGSKLWKEQLQRLVVVLAGVGAIYALVQSWNSRYSPSIWFSLHSAEIGYGPIAPQSSYDAHISPSMEPQGLVQEYGSDASKDTNDLSPQGLVEGNRRNDSMLDHALSPHGVVQGDVKRNISLGLDGGSSSAKGSFNVSNEDGLSNNFSVGNQNNVNASVENSVREESHNSTKDTNSFSVLNAVNVSSQKGYNRPQHDQDWEKILEQQLTFAKNEIENSPAVLAKDPDLYGPLYHNLSRFKRSYEIMENFFKVYVYSDGEKPFFHKGPMEGIYASEGWFMKQMEENKQFVTKDFRKAFMYYIPYSVYEMRVGVHASQYQNVPQITIYLKDQINMLASKYPFWNRTHGRDHFFVACHDWGPYTTAGHNELKLNAVKVLCNADLSDGFFHLGKDGGLPETNLHGLEQPPAGLGGLYAIKRPILAFFAGGNHGRVRPVLFKYWKEKDPDIRVYQNLPSEIAKKKSYVQHMKESKFCICPMGYEVNSPRMVEAIYYDCVPVIIADNFFLPFSEVLKWQSFSVIVAEKDIPNLKNILLGISEKRYLTMYFRVGKVRKHFLWHKDSPKRYDIFHMILHSVWTSRLNQTPFLA